MAANKSLHIIGGTYLETCIEPPYHELFGSGLRAACAISDKGFDIIYTSCISNEELEVAQSTCSIYNIKSNFIIINETVHFEYYHPLSKPVAFSSVLNEPVIALNTIKADFILFYGMIETAGKVEGDYVVYDPQNGIPFSATNSKAQHLALVLNRHEAISLANLDSDDLERIGAFLLKQEKAEVVIIKDGSNGGLVVTSSGVESFPVYGTAKVWPIGSGDIFSAAFAWKWMMEKALPHEAADFASKCTADFCETQVLPLLISPNIRTPIPRKVTPRKIYLAAPFFNSAERWLVNELREQLIKFGNQVFSPYHDVGVINAITSLDAQKEIAQQDLVALDRAHTILAVLNGLDAGTLIEIGYAVAKGKKVVVLMENINSNDLTMIAGSGCIMVADISSAVYKASW